MTKFCGSCDKGMPEGIHSDKVYCMIEKQYHKEYHECNISEQSKLGDDNGK